MNIILLVTGLIALLIGGFIVFRLVKVRRQRERLHRQQFERIQPLYDKIQAAAALSEEEVSPYAIPLLTRETTFHLLNEAGKTGLFPADLFTIEKAAESNLAIWLEFPTELDTCPDEMELVKKVSMEVDAEDLYYYVFRFRTNEPHWAAPDGWMLGVVGPYFNDSKPYDFPFGTFSRLSKFDTTLPEEEAMWVHENISMKNWAR